MAYRTREQKQNTSIYYTGLELMDVNEDPNESVSTGEATKMNLGETANVKGNKQDGHRKQREL